MKTAESGIPMEREYSKRLGAIRPGQFQAALSRFGLGDFLRAEPVPSGLFGQNVFVTSTQGEFVLRGAPHNPLQFPTERFFTEQLRRRTRVPVPHPYLFEPATGIFGWSFAVMPRLPGFSPADGTKAAALSLKDRMAITRALASTLVEAHTLTWSRAGKYDPETDGIRPFELPYGEWEARRIRRNLAAACGSNKHTTATDLAWAERIITDAAGATAEHAAPCAILADYGEHNVVVERAADGWRVSGVFDLMTAHCGDGNADLCQPVAGYLKTNPALADEFVREYLRIRPAGPGFAERQRFYALGLHASMWEYWQRARGGPPGNPEIRFEDWARPAVDYWKGRFG